MAMSNDDANILMLLRSLLLEERDRNDLNDLSDRSDHKLDSSANDNSSQLTINEINSNESSINLLSSQSPYTSDNSLIADLPQISHHFLPSNVSLNEMLSLNLNGDPSNDPSSPSSVFQLMPEPSVPFEESVGNALLSLPSSSSSIQTSHHSTNDSFQCSQIGRFESQIRAVANEIQSTIQMHLNGLQMRKETLLKQLEHIKQIYANVIASQSNAPLPQISFTRPDSALYKAVTSLGFLTTPAFSANCVVSGEGLEVAVESQPSCFTIVTRNCFNEELMIGGEKIDIDLTAMRDETIEMSIPHSLVDHNNGKYTCTYTIPRGGRVTKVMIRIAVNGLPMRGPFVVNVEAQRTRHAWRRIATFGCEGNGVGQFCRPWGVACVRVPNNSTDLGNQKEFLLAVADRSNNRIQLLKLITSGTSSPQISVVHVFGSGPGTRPGQFDRPAGIAINGTLGHIIVADKDNHRVQVFDMNGNYQFKFGEKGSRAGQFCYPWDLDSSPHSHQILVSDTRNRRLQLFTPYGQYLWHIGQPLDSPRGVAFLSSDKFVVSDFNKHRLLILDRSANTDELSPKYVGFGEGSAWGEFLRPQGVSVGGSSMVLCSDSRNNRISIWCASTQSFEYLTDDVVSLDRPAGLAVADNLLVVVDFGNNRIQICQR